MPDKTDEGRLKAYELYIPSNSSLVERVFGIALVIILALFIGLGLFLNTIKVLPEPVEKKIEEIKTHFVMETRQKPKPVKPIEKKKPVEKKEEEKPIDLTQKPVLAQKQNDIPEESRPATNNAPVVKSVYGLRRVYSTGIGTQGNLSDAVIGKLGNTINKEIDTVTATRQQLKGALVPVTTVTDAPSLKNAVKPEYSKQMIDAKLEGVIKAEILIDVDGMVKDVRILNDLGYGTAEAARKAFMQWIFEPAKVNGKAAAVWITYSIRFVLVQ
jgi:TonB family protein